MKEREKKKKKCQFPPSKLRYDLLDINKNLVRFKACLTVENVFPTSGNKAITFT